MTQNQNNNGNQEVCEECSRPSPSGNFWGKKDGHQWCNTCYKRLKRHGGSGIVTVKPSIAKQVAIKVPKSVAVKTPEIKPAVIPEMNSALFEKFPVKINLLNFIPKHNGYIPRKIGNLNDMEILDRCYKKGYPVLITGEAGTGKNHCVRNFCFKKKLPYSRINLNGASTTEEILGQFIPDEAKGNGAIKWQDGVLTTAVRYGGVVVMDEVNAMPPEIGFCLHALTDDEKRLTLTQKDGEVIEAHPNFFLVCTMNPDYEGTNVLNEAFKDRFRILEYKYDTKIEKKLISNPKMLELANMLRISKNKGELRTPISTRLLLQHQENMKMFGDKVAFEMFWNKFEPSEREAVKNVWEQISSQKLAKDDNKITDEGDSF